MLSMLFWARAVFAVLKEPFAITHKLQGSFSGEKRTLDKKSSSNVVFSIIQSAVPLQSFAHFTARRHTIRSNQMRRFTFYSRKLRPLFVGWFVLTYVVNCHAIRKNTYSIHLRERRFYQLETRGLMFLNRISFRVHTLVTRMARFLPMSKTRR